MGLPIWRESHSNAHRESLAKIAKQQPSNPQEDARSPIRRSRRSTRRFQEDVSRDTDLDTARALDLISQGSFPVEDISRISTYLRRREVRARRRDAEPAALRDRPLPSVTLDNQRSRVPQSARAREEDRLAAQLARSNHPAFQRPSLQRSRSSSSSLPGLSNVDLDMSLFELTRLSTEEQIRIMRETLAYSSPPIPASSAPVLVREDTLTAPRAAGESFMTDATVADMDVDATPRTPIISDVRSFLNEIRPEGEEMEREASAGGAADQARAVLSFYSDSEPRRRVTRVDGLGDRDRSLSPDDAWETLLTNITPDSRLPSAESSFTSAAASFSASSSALSLGAQSSSTNPTSTSSHSLNQCEYSSTSDASDTEADDMPTPRAGNRSRAFGSGRAPTMPMVEGQLPHMTEYLSNAGLSYSDFFSLPPSLTAPPVPVSAMSQAEVPQSRSRSRLQARDLRRDVRDVRRAREAERERRRAALHGLPMPPQNPTLE